MEENQLIQELEAIAETLSISVRYEDLMEADFKVKGGLCKLKGENVIIMDKKIPLRERIDLLVRALNQFDLSPIFIKPYIRHLLGDDSRDRDTGTPEGETEIAPSPSDLRSR